MAWTAGTAASTSKSARGTRRAVVDGRRAVGAGATQVDATDHGADSTRTSRARRTRGRRWDRADARAAGRGVRPPTRVDGVSDALPMFPLNAVLFPGVSVPLTVFEDRYRALVHHLLRVEDPEERVFGSVGIREGYEIGDHGAQSLFRVGCRVQLTEVESNPDGTFDIVAVGLERIELERLETGGAVPGRPRRRPPRAAGLRARPRRSSGPGRRSPPTGRRWPRSAPTPTPARCRKDPTYLSWTLAAVAPLPLQERQALLEAEDAAHPAGPGHRPAARRAAGDERDPLAARHRGRPHPLVAELRSPRGQERTQAGRRAGRRPPSRSPAPASPSRCTSTTHDPRAESYGLEAAEALGLDPDRVLKTLMASVDGRLVVAVVPVSGRLDLKALARAVGGSPGGDGRPCGGGAGDRLRRRRHLPRRPEAGAPHRRGRVGAARTRRSSSPPAGAASTSSSRRPTSSGSPGPTDHGR